MPLERRLRREASRCRRFEAFSCYAAPVRRASLPAQRKIVPVNHFSPAFNAKQKQDISGWSALDLFGIDGIVGHETPADLGAIRTTHDDGIAAGKLSVDPNDPNRQQTIASP